MNQHSLTVWKIMQKIALEKTWNQDYANAMFLLWYLHDIGKVFWYTWNHAEEGGKILEKSDYHYRKEVYYHGKIDIEYSSPELDLLNFADLQVLQNGEQVTLSERLEDIGNRYGSHSSVYEEAKLLAKNLHLK